MADTARLDELRRHFEEHPRRYFAPLASALRRAGDPAAAATLARAQLAVYPGHLTGHVILGQALVDLGDVAGARGAFARAAAVDGGNVVALQQLVTLARTAGDLDDARRWMDRLVEADPELAAELGPTPGGGAFEPLDFAPAADESGAAFSAGALDPRLMVETPSAPQPAVAPPADPLAFVEPLDFVPDALAGGPAAGPVVGLDEPPADPIPLAMREAGVAALGEDDGAAPVVPPGGAFVTETMAELLVAQGHVGDAAAVYEQLLAQRPGDDRLRARLAALRGDVAEAAPAADDGDDSAAAAMWRAAFAPLPADAVEPVGARAAVASVAPAPAPAPAAVPAGPPAAVTAGAGVDDDLAQFNAWLRGLAE